MFYVKTLEHEIVLQPVHFGPKLKATIVRLLKEEVEGLALANYGYVVNVIEVPEDQIKSGIIEYDSGCRLYRQIHGAPTPTLYQ